MPNPIWTGAVTFGMVSIPVRLYPATEEKDVHFHLLHKTDLSRIAQRYYCPEDGELLEWHQLVRGYQVAHDHYVVLSEEELASVPVSTLNAIEIDAFVNLRDIDPIYFQRSYYLEPEELGLKPFALLLRVIEESGLAAIAKFTLRQKEHACVLRAYGNTIALSPLLYNDEVRPTDGLKNAAAVEVDPNLLAQAERYIEALTTEFSHASYSDSYRKALRALIEDKAAALTPPAAKHPAPSMIPDLMAALREAVEQAQKPKNRRRKQETAKVPIKT